MADSLVDQIFEQARLGSAQGQGIPGFAEGQRINLANRQLGVELAQLPLKMTLAQQEAQSNQLKLEEFLRNRDDILKAESAMNDLSKDIAPLIQTGKLDEARQRLAAAGLSNNVLLTNQRYQAIDNQLGAMEKLRADQEYKLGQLQNKELYINMREQNAQLHAQTLLQVQGMKGELATSQQEIARLKEERLGQRDIDITQSHSERVFSQDKILQNWQASLDKLQTKLDGMVSKPMLRTQASWDRDKVNLQGQIEGLNKKISERQGLLLKSNPGPQPIHPAIGGSGKTNTLIFQNGKFVPAQ